MRILIISSQYPPTIGGGGTHSSYLANALATLKSKNVEICVLTSSIPPLSKRERKLDRLEIVRSDFELSGNTIYEAALTNALELCRTFKPHLIHGQHIDGAIVGLQLKAAFDIPLIITLHKTPMLRYDDSLPQRSSTYSTIKMIAKNNNVDCFIAGSKIFEKELRKIGGRQTPIKKIYHGVPFKFLQSLAFNEGIIKQVKEAIDFKEDEKVIVCPTRLDERKGLDCLLNAILSLREKGYLKQFKLVITGDVRLGHKKDLEMRDRLLNIGVRGHFEESLIFKKFPFEHLPALFGMSSVCILPSRKEGLGLVLLEAMAVRCPIIAANSPGIDELIINDYNGLLFEPDDVDDLVGQLIRFENDGITNDLKRNGLKTVKSKFSAERMSEQTVKLYKKFKK